MSSFVRIECPHCGVKGKLSVPNEGMILIGPCPQCEGYVAVFCGKALPLERETMANGTGRERRDHLLEVLTVFLEQSIGETLEPDLPHGGIDGGLDYARGEDGLPDTNADLAGAMPISQDEVDRFISVSLSRIDNRDYFKGVFRKG